jgi:ribonucleoside-diphosphate reductase beta chain
MQITLRYARQHKVLPGYYAGFTLTARDEARHVQAGLRFLTEAIEQEDPTLILRFSTRSALCC